MRDEHRMYTTNTSRPQAATQPRYQPYTRELRIFLQTLPTEQTASRPPEGIPTNFNQSRPLHPIPSHLSQTCREQPLIHSSRTTLLCQFSPKLPPKNKTTPCTEYTFSNSHQYSTNYPFARLGFYPTFHPSLHHAQLDSRVAHTSRWF